MKSAHHAVQEFVTVLNEHDVLLGRGAPILNSAGNVRFRNLIKENRAAYTATGRHAVKDQIAKKILDTITENGGRFLRKIESDDDRTKYNVPSSVLHAWVSIDRMAQLQKVKQALREQVTSRISSRRKKGDKRREQQGSSETSVAGSPAASASSSHPSSLDEVAREYQRNILQEAPISDQTLLMHGRLAVDRRREDQYRVDPHRLRSLLPQLPPSSLEDLYGYGPPSLLDRHHHHRSSDRDVSNLLDQYVLDLQLRGELLARELAIARAAQRRAAALGGDVVLPSVVANEAKLPSSSSSSDESDQDRHQPAEGDGGGDGRKPEAK